MDNKYNNPNQQPPYRQDYQQQGYPQQGYPQQPNYQQPQGYPRQIYVNAAPQQKSNGIGVAGFVLALLALIFCWVPVLDIILWLLGAIFSIIGIFKAPRGLAIAGTIISFIGIIILIFCFAALIGLGTAAAAW